MKKATDKELSVLEKHEVKTDWREKAQWRRENRRWLRYSGFIALTVMHRLEELKMSQKELAEKMNCSPQYVSKLLKGSENLTLDTQTPQGFGEPNSGHHFQVGREPRFGSSQKRLNPRRWLLLP